MNIVSYNLVKFQNDNKLNSKKLSFMLGITPKQLRKMKRDNYQFSDQEIKKISDVTLISVEDLVSKMNERINLKERKIYGTTYMYVNYEVLEYKHHNINFISAIVDLLFILVLAIFLFTKQISLTVDYTPLLNVLKVIFIIELLVFPFMFIVLPLLKVYFNRTYRAVLRSNIKEYYQEEACGIIFSCLRRSINKSIIPYFFTIFSEAVIALYSLLYLTYIKSIDVPYLIMIILFVISFTVSILSFKYHFGKNGHQVSKE